MGWDIFDFFSETTKQNSTKLDRKQYLNVLYQVSVFFLVYRKKKMATPASDLQSHFQLLWNRWKEFNETWQEARSQRPLTSLSFSGRSEKIKWPPLPLMGWDIFDFSSETTEWNLTKLDRKQHLNLLYQVYVFSSRSEKQDCCPASDWPRHFWILLWMEFNETWQSNIQGLLSSSSCTFLVVELFYQYECNIQTVFFFLWQ